MLYLFFGVVSLPRHWPDRHGQWRTPTTGRRHGQSLLEPQEKDRRVSRNVLRHRAGQTWRVFLFITLNNYTVFLLQNLILHSEPCSVFSERTLSTKMMHTADWFKALPSDTVFIGFTRPSYIFSLNVVMKSVHKASTVQSAIFVGETMCITEHIRDMQILSSYGCSVIVRTRLSTWSRSWASYTVYLPPSTLFTGPKQNVCTNVEPLAVFRVRHGKDALCRSYGSLRV